MSCTYPVIYSKETHKIDLNWLDRDALKVITTLQGQGHVTYLVGGGVRDLLRKHPPKDFDVSTDASPEQIKAIFGRRCLIIGRRFRLCHVRFGSKVIEVSTFRAQDQSSGDDLVMDDNVFGSPQEDALRRDFTMNGLFYDPQDETVIDYVGGVVDLNAHALRCIGDPSIRFRQDPVRMIRLLKFQARFGFSIDPVMRDMICTLRAEITKSAQARVLEELLRMLESRAASPFFMQLHETGLLELIIPPLAKYLSHGFDTTIFAYLEAADRMVKVFGKRHVERSVLVAALFFPILDARLKKIQEEEERTPHLGQIGIMAHDLLNQIMRDSFSRFPRKLLSDTAHVLLNQYRLAPLHNRLTMRKKFIDSRDFLPALKFFKIRSLIHPEHKDLYESWKAKFQELGSPQPPRETKSCGKKRSSGSRRPRWKK